jgi:thiamine-phosphate pyrophosphorylase
MNLSGDARRLWATAVDLNRAVRPVSPAPRRALPPLLFFTDPARTPEPWRTAAALPAGAGVVYRHFGAEDAGATAERLRQVTAEAGVRLLIGQDGPLAQAIGADGLHLPERDLARAGQWRTERPDWLITAAIHATEGLTDPARLGLDLLGLDALVLSPVFAAGGASAAKPALGLEAFSAAVRDSLLPVYALGGIKPDNVEHLAGSGACGIAGVDAVTAAFE